MSTESRGLPEYADLPPEIEPHVRYAHGALDRLKFATTSDARIFDIHQAREGINALLRYALAHSRAQDSGGEAVIEAAREVLDTELGVIGCLGSDSPAEHAIGKLSRAMSEHLNARRFAAEQPAKGEKWRCACGDLNYPNETCAMCNQSAPQPSDPADAVCDCAARVDGGSHSRDCSAYATPPTAQRHDEGARDAGGRIVREAWVKWALTQPNPKPSWLAPYDELSEPDKEADRQIFEACTVHGAGAAVEAVDEAIGIARDYREGIFNDGEMQCAMHVALSTQPLLNDRPAGVSNELRLAGTMLANCAFNLAQRPHLTDDERRSLDLSRRAWDAALHPEQAKDGGVS